MLQLQKVIDKHFDFIHQTDALCPSCYDETHTTYMYAGQEVQQCYEKKIVASAKFQ